MEAWLARDEVGAIVRYTAFPFIAGQPHSIKYPVTSVGYVLFDGSGLALIERLLQWPQLFQWHVLGRLGDINDERTIDLHCVQRQAL